MSRGIGSGDEAMGDGGVAFGTCETESLLGGRGLSGETSSGCEAE